MQSPLSYRDPGLPLVLLVGAFLGACSADDLVLPGAGAPEEIAVVSGDAQSARAGRELPDPLVARVTDRDGNPLPDIEVRWTADGGGAVDPASAVSNEGGLVTAHRTLGEEPGLQTTRAEVFGRSDLDVVFAASALPLGAPRLALARQPANAAQSGTAFDPQPIVQLTTSDGDPLRRGDVTVTAAIASGSGQLEGNTSRATGSDGRVEFTGLAITGSAGTHTLIFAADGMASVLSEPIEVTAPPSGGDDGGDDGSGDGGDGGGNDDGGGGGGGNGGGNGGGGEGGPGRPNRLVFLEQPSDVEEDELISPPVQVAVVDAGGEVVTSHVGEVRLELGRNSRDAKLKGDRWNPTHDGVASFPELEVDNEGEYTLEASMNGLPSVESSAFRVDDRGGRGRGGGGGRGGNDDQDQDDNNGDNGDDD